MNCYQCGCPLSEHGYCTNCGVDVSIYKKIMMVSNRFYNEGLEKAGVRDLTGAINSLRQSLKFNKNNVEARNLLGLVYFEVGEVVAALSEWVISKNLRPKKNIADSYIEMIQSNPTRLETINQTIKKYNQALLYCNQDSKDLAVIQLKKVLSLNPKFVRAHQLLALLYIDAEEWQKAEKELHKCEKIDGGDTTTKRYLKEVEEILYPPESESGGKKRKKKVDKDEVFRYQSGNETIIRPLDVKEPKGVSLSSFVYLLIGLLIGVGITVFLILPAQIQTAKAEVSTQLKTVGEKLTEKSATIEEMNGEMEKLTKEKEDLQRELDAYLGTDGKLQTMDDMMAAVDAYLKNPDQTVEVAGYLETIRAEAVLEETSEAFQAVYNTLLGIIGPEVASTYYKDGLDAYKAEKYEDAITNLSKALIYDEENADIIYNLGNAYYQSGDMENAAKYYQIVADKFPGTEKARRSRQYLEDIANA